MLLNRKQIKFYLINVIILASSVSAFAQDFNPPFPRTMFQRPAGPVVGAIQHFFARYNLAIIGDRGANAWACVDSIRQLNENCIIFGTSRQGVWPESDPPETFMFRHAFAELTQPANPGDGVVYVTNTNGFRLGRYEQFALIGYDDWIEYGGMTETSFTGVTSSGAFAVDSVHPVGDSVKTPIRFPGLGMLPNFTLFAPDVGNQKVWEFFVDKRFDQQDFSYFDGTFWDAFRIYFWSEDPVIYGVDIDYNRVDDLQEHGLNWLNSKWTEGIKRLLDYEHQKFAELHPGSPSIATINIGGVDTGYIIDYCDGMMWEGFMRFASSWHYSHDLNMVWAQKDGHVFTMIEDYEPEHRSSYCKNVLNRMRYGLTSALMAAAYYGRTFGDYYYISYYHDEFDTDLGYPTENGGPYETSNGAFVRFFDKGAAICNPTGTIITVTDADISGFAGYAGPYYKFLGGQAPEHNNGELFDSVELHGETRSPIRQNQGDGILLFIEPTTSISDIVVGNTFNNDTSPKCEEVALSGSWQQVYDVSKNFPNRNPCYSQWIMGPEGIGYAVAGQGSGGSSATFTPMIGVDGYYEVFEWHGWHGDSPTSYQLASNVPYEIVVNGETVREGFMDQSKNFGKWNRLGIFYFPTGDSSYVKISNNANGMVIADAVNFRFKGKEKLDNEPPAPPQGVRIE